MRRVCCLLTVDEQPRKHDLLYSHMQSNKVAEFEFTGDSTRNSDGLVLFEVEDNRYVTPDQILG